MDIDKIIDDLNINIGNDNKNDDQGPEAWALNDLLTADIITDDIRMEIYNRFKAAAVKFIDDYINSPQNYDLKAVNMFYASYDTWQTCIKEFGRQYFQKNKLLHDIKREAVEGGARLRDDLLLIGLDVYESLCGQYKKVFQVYACALFLGVSVDNMHKLNTAHGRWTKSAHGAAENSLRSGALNNRGSTVGYAMILNHDYAYTKTTEVIHTTGHQEIAAANLPQLEGPAGGDQM